MAWMIWKLFTGTLKSLKIGTLMGRFIPSRKCMSLKVTEELGVMTMKNVTKFLRGIDLSFQNWHEEFDIFWTEHSKVSTICTFMGSSWIKYIIFELKKYSGIIFHDTEQWCKIWRKTNVWFGKWHEKFGKSLQAEKWMWIEELNQNQNLKRLDQSDEVWNFCFSLEVNE